ncbi:MAG: hypothetical protein ACTSWY_04040 [Promethearchaeota archaeon]
MVINSFSGRYKNKLLGLIFYASIFLYHRPSFILISVVVIIVGLKPFVSLLDRKINSFLKNKLRNRSFDSSPKKIKRITILIIVLVVMVLIFALFPIWINFFTFLVNKLDYILNSVILERKYIIPSWDLWISQLSGPIIIGLGFSSILLIKNPQHLFGQNKKIFNFMCVFMIFFVTICHLLPTWANITFLPYNYFRYFIYIDLALIILAPISLKYIFEKIKTRVEEGKKNYKNVKKTIIIIFWVQIALFSTLHIQEHYFMDYCHTFEKDDFLDAYFWLRHNISIPNSNPLIMVTPYPISNSEDVTYQSVLFDKYLVSHSESLCYFDEIYHSINNITEFLVVLKDYFQNGTKQLHQGGRSLAENLTTTSMPIRYLIVDSLHDPRLPIRMNEDPAFHRIYFENITDHEAYNTTKLIYKYYTISIFKIVL